MQAKPLLEVGNKPKFFCKFFQAWLKLIPWNTPVQLFIVEPFLNCFPLLQPPNKIVGRGA